MEIVFSIIGSTVAIVGLQLTIMTKAVELNGRITKLESATSQLIYMQREQTTILQRVSTIEAMVDNNNRIMRQVKSKQEEE